jgi:hypothetical protein
VAAHRAESPSQDHAPTGLPRLHDVLAHYPGVREYHLRTLQKFGLIGRPQIGDRGRLIAFADLAVIRRLYNSLQGGASFKTILRAMLASHEGQLVLDFCAEVRPAKVVTINPSRPQLPASPLGYAPPVGGPEGTAEEYFLEGSSFDDGTAANQSYAAEAYRRALEVDPGLVPALINLANIYYANRQPIEAMALYERAIRLDPEVFEGHFNLGNIHHDLGRYADAKASYTQAIVLNPTHAESHLYLAVVLEKSHRSDEARAHWRDYYAIAPNGEWADLAREFSE